jgi:hypothetical protein
MIHEVNVGITAAENFVDLANKDYWDNAYKKLPGHLQDIYYTSDYYAIHEKNSGSKAVCYIYSEAENIFIYPFLLTEVPSDYSPGHSVYYDIEGAYGYNGPLANTTDYSFIEKAVIAFNGRCRDQKIIAEFTRFNPALQNHLYRNDMKVINANENIILDLSEDDIWMQAYEHSTRKNIKKAERSGLTAYHVKGEDISKDEMKAFLQIYYSTMERNNAKGEYFFPENYFNDIARLPNGSSTFFFTELDKKIVSCELVLAGKEIGYSYLGGTLSDYFSLRANDILKHHIIQTLKQGGLRYYCLGGGTEPGDGIYKYKKCFAKDGSHKFYIGKKIYDETIYNKVVSNWKESNPEKAEVYKNYLLKYKY